MITMNTRAMRRTLRFTGLSVITLAILASCNLMNTGPTSIAQCLSEFSSGYTGGSYGTLYTYFSQNTTDYGAMKAASFWDTTEFASANSPHALSGYTISGTTVTGPFYDSNFPTGVTSPTATITITMEQDGLYWYIRTLDIVNNSGKNVTSIS